MGNPYNPSQAESPSEHVVPRGPSSDDLAPGSRRVQAAIAGNTVNGVPTLAAAGSTQVSLTGVLDDYVSGDVTLQILASFAASTPGQVAKITRTTGVNRSGAAVNTVENGVAMDQTYADQNVFTITTTISFANVQSRDSIQAVLARAGNDVADTAGDLLIRGAWLSYTGRA